MAEEFDRILDECMDRINRGEELEACLADYPQHASQLSPLLRAMLQTKEAYGFTPSAGAKLAGKQRFNAALVEMERKRAEKRSPFAWLMPWPRMAGVVATVLVLALIGYVGLSQGSLPVPLPLWPSQPGPGPGTVVVTAPPSTEGNFVFLMSDEVNAIADFESLDVSISRVSLQMAGEDRVVEFVPEVETVDLTLLQGDLAQEVWRGDITEGKYNKVVIEVSEVRGVLKESGESIEIKLPSNKLQISKDFDVASGQVTSFVYDLTVIARGNQQSGIRYNLLPQAGESGADQTFEKVQGKGKEKQLEEKPPLPPQADKNPNK